MAVPHLPTDPAIARPTVLLTGAAGNIGHVLRAALANTFELILTDIRTPTDLQAHETFRAADLEEQPTRKNRTR